MLRIGQLARSAGFSAKTLRYYEDLGLLRPSRRSASNYRLYDGAAVGRLAFVRRAQGLGLCLEDIRRILEISDEGRVPCEHVIGVVDRELDRITAQFGRLHELRKEFLGLRLRLSEALESGDARPGKACPCFQKEGEE